MIKGHGGNIKDLAKTLSCSIDEIIAKIDENIKANPEIEKKDIKAAIIKTINRRPCTKQDLLQLLGVDMQILEKHITLLEQEKIILGKLRERGIFYQTIKDKEAS